MRAAKNNWATALPKPLATCLLATALVACGGGSGGGVGFTPPPPGPPAPPPPPPGPGPTGPSIVTGATASQQFATKGAAYSTPLAVYGPLTVSAPELADVSQLDIRYDAAAQRYEIQLPNSTDWAPIHEASRYNDQQGAVESVLYRASAPQDLGLIDHRLSPGLTYSALMEWFTDSASGYSAIGVATLPGAVPTSGSASYAGSLLGSSSETYLDWWEGVYSPGRITGDINLAFNFGTGSLSGSISPWLNETALPSLAFTNTVFGIGSTTFSGAFGTSLAGVNSFSGRFTGPAAQEVIGNFAFPYTSLQDGSTQQAGGAFAGKRQ